MCQVKRQIIVLAVSLTVILGTLLESRPAQSREQDCVVLLHGLFRTAASMKPLEWYLEYEGFAAVNNSYASVSQTVEALAAQVVPQGIGECRDRGHSRVHFVTHSMGGILVRQYASTHRMPADTRVVMLGPPNQGSQVADYWGGFELYDMVDTQVLGQLGTGEMSVARRLGPVNFQLGVIAGNLRGKTMLPGFPDQPSDGTVSVAETVVPGMMDFLQMPVLHTFMIWNPLVMAQTVHFLRTGAFQREETPEAEPVIQAFGSEQWPPLVPTSGADAE